MYIEKPGQLVQDSSVADSSYFKHAECVRRFNLLLEFVVGGLNQVDEDLNQDFMIQEYLQIMSVHCAKLRCHSLSMLSFTATTAK